jgi:anti-anti-sigma factor
MSDTFTVNITSEGDVTVLELVGEFDLGGLSTFNEALAAVDPSAAQVVIDLSALTFVDSTGLGCFARSHNELEARGAKLVLRAPSKAVRRILDVLDLGQSMEIID